MSLFLKSSYMFWVWPVGSNPDFHMFRPTLLTHNLRAKIYRYSPHMNDHVRSTHFETNSKIKMEVRKRRQHFTCSIHLI